MQNTKIGTDVSWSKSKHHVSAKEQREQHARCTEQKVDIVGMRRKGQDPEE